MKKILGILAVLTFALGICSAQVPTSCTNNVDNNGNICTTITTSGDQYSPYTGYDFPEKTEDGKAFPADFNAAVSAPSNFYFYIGLAYDPLLLPGGPLANPYGYVTTDLSGYTMSFSTSNVLPVPKTVGAVMRRDVYTFYANNAAAGTYPYTWYGSFTLQWVCTRVVVERFVGPTCVMGAGTGTAILSAIHQ